MKEVKLVGSSARIIVSDINEDKINGNLLSLINGSSELLEKTKILAKGFQRKIYERFDYIQINQNKMSGVGTGNVEFF